MNEIIITGSTGLGNSALGKVTARIIKSINSEIGNEKARALDVAKVANEELYAKAGFESVAEWAEKFFGWNKSKVSRYCSIVREFADNAEIWDAYSVTQMIECLSLKGDYKPMTDGRIIPEMSAKEIREFVKEYKTVIDIGTDAEGTPETGAEGAPETDAEGTPETEGEKSFTFEGHAADIAAFINSLGMDADTRVKITIDLF